MAGGLQRDGWHGPIRDMWQHTGAAPRKEGEMDKRLIDAVQSSQGEYEKPQQAFELLRCLERVRGVRQLRVPPLDRR